jgi:hypothetical protein
MGLDMWIKGTDTAENAEHDIELHYWRKHANLHGYMVQEFGEGDDNQEPIELTEHRIVLILNALVEQTLPTTTGFFFGASQDTKEEQAEDIEAFTQAQAWLEERPDTRKVIYQSWW